MRYLTRSLRDVYLEWGAAGVTVADRRVCRDDDLKCVIGRRDLLFARRLEAVQVLRQSDRRRRGRVKRVIAQMLLKNAFSKFNYNRTGASRCLRVL